MADIRPPGSAPKAPPARPAPPRPMPRPVAPRPVAPGAKGPVAAPAPAAAGGGSKGVGVPTTAPKAGASPTLEKAAAAVAPKKKFRLFARVKQKEITQFTVQFAVLLDAGLPVVRALKILSGQQKEGPFKDTIEKVAEDVEGGSSLSEALNRHPKVFDRLYVNMVRAGEAGGVLDTILKRLAGFMEKAQRLKRKIISASTYPAVVISVAVLIVVGLMVKVVPQFSKVFEGQNLAMPAITQLLLKISATMQQCWYIILLLPVALVVAYSFAQKNPKIKFQLDALKMRIPLFGEILRKASTARFTRTLGTLLSSGVQILEAYTIIRNAIGNEVFAAAIQKIHDNVKEGEGIAVSMRQTKVFNEMVVNMVQVGEETGELDKMLIKVADNYDDEVDTAVDGLMAALEPILIVGIALVIGFIVVALFMPLVSLMNSFGGGG